MYEWKQHEGETAWRQVPEWVKRYLIEQRGYCCEECQCDTHNGSSIPLVVDYRDGNSHNNAEENLELICPNCKSQK